MLTRRERREGGFSLAGWAGASWPAGAREPGPLAARLLGLGVAAVLLALPSRGLADLSGRYVGHGARLDVVDSRARVLVIYRAEPADPALFCECTLEGERQADGPVKLAGAMEGAALRTAGNRLIVLEAENSVCCGLTWPGRDAFELDARSSLPRCRVRRTGAPWYALTGSAEGEAYRREGGACAPGEEVVAVPDAPDDRFVPARRTADGRAGFLLRTDLDCLLPRSAPTARGARPAPPPARESSAVREGAPALPQDPGRSVEVGKAPPPRGAAADPAGPGEDDPRQEEPLRRAAPLAPDGQAGR